MRRLIADMNPFLRGMLVVAAIAGIVVLFQLYAALAVVSGLLRIAFFLAIAFFVYLMWRERRSEIELWSPRAKWVFYTAAALIVVDLGAFFSPFRRIQLSGFSALSFVLVLVLCAFSMWRVWRDERSYLR
jgi:drug/metabolite transporter (DMT)-like permease